MTMTTALWCVLAAMVLPYFFTIYAKTSSGFKPKHNHAPRDFLATAEGAAKRANWAQQNSWEVNPAFFAAVIIAQMVGTLAQGTLDTLAIAFVISRVLYGLLYIWDLALLRSLVWFVGLAIIVALFVLSA